MLPGFDYRCSSSAAHILNGEKSQQETLIFNGTLLHAGVDVRVQNFDAAALGILRITQLQEGRKEAIKALIRQIGEQIVQELVLNAIRQAFRSSALGNVFSGGSIEEFRHGGIPGGQGIIERPMSFTMGDGRGGVRIFGSGAPVPRIPTLFRAPGRGNRHSARPAQRLLQRQFGFEVLQHRLPLG